MPDVESTTTLSVETPAPPPGPGQTRSARKERRFVRGLIGLLLVVLTIEAVAHFRMTILQQRLWTELQRGERENQGITRQHIDAVAGRPPDEELAASFRQERYDVYHFWGLLKQRELCVHYGVSGINAEPEVMDILLTLPEDAQRP